MLCYIVSRILYVLALFKWGSPDFQISKIEVGGSCEQNGPKTVEIPNQIEIAPSAFPVYFEASKSLSVNGNKKWEKVNHYPNVPFRPSPTTDFVY